MIKKYKEIGIARTLKELKTAINLAIEVSGEDAEWNGFDNGHIYIHSKQDGKEWSFIANDPDAEF